VKEQVVARSWTHAFEEDEGNLMVFRPSDSPAIRPSRMPRMAIDLKDSGELTTYAPGPDDRRVAGPGTWRLDGEHLVLEPEAGPAQRYVVDDATEDRLVLRPADEIQQT
jgi:hypothetical protein